MLHCKIEHPPSLIDIQQIVNEFLSYGDTTFLKIDYIPENISIEVDIYDEMAYDIDTLTKRNKYISYYGSKLYFRIECQALQFFLKIPVINVNNIILSCVLQLLMEPSKDNLEYMNKTLFHHNITSFESVKEIQQVIYHSLRYSEHMSDNYYRHTIETYRDVIPIMAALIIDFSDTDQNDKLIPIIETVDPEPILDYFTKHDIEKLPMLIELFNQYGKYEELTL